MSILCCGNGRRDDRGRIQVISENETTEEELRNEEDGDNQNEIVVKLTRQDI